MKRCLIVDDNSMDRLIARALVETFGFETYEARNGLQALEFCEELMPEYIILDWIMPHSNGMEFLSELRSMPEGDKPYVMMCTAQDYSEENRQLALSIGANDFVSKPLSKETVMGAFSLSVFA